MNFIKRAMLSITRRKGKSFILFAVIFILGNLIAGAISIQQATTNVEETIKNKLGSIATIDLDYKKVQEKITESGQEKIEAIPLKDIKKFGELPAVKYYDYSINTYVGSETIKPYSGKSNLNVLESSEQGMNFKLKGIQHEAVLDFKERKAKLLEGRVFEKDEIEKGTNHAIISKKVATENNLNVGDTFVVNKDVYDYKNSSMNDLKSIATREVPLKVIGIFEPIEVKKEDQKPDAQKDMMAGFADKEYQNTIYVPNVVVEKEANFEAEELKKVDPENTSEQLYLPTYVLKSPEDSQVFKDEVAPQLSDIYKVSSSSDSYNSIAAPIKSMAKLSRYVLIAALGATLLIIGLVVLLFVRDRKHEFGIYLSLGEKRLRVLGQVIIEVAVVALIAISFSVFSGNILANNVSNSMIQNQLEADNEEENQGSPSMLTFGGNENQFGQDVSAEDVAKAYEVKISASYVLLFYVVGLSTIMVSTLIPVVYIVRLNPKKIML